MALPAQIGPYRVLRLLGAGGMGRVYLAEQQEPRREVALKVLHSAAAAATFQQRFRREIELMAALDHPGIARVYAAGEAPTDSGPLPYVAMEYVRGADLLAHAGQQHLSLQQRLALIASVSRAVHYAHTRGVIHRDLKPGNILVDAHGQPKILDFGVARVLGRDDATQMTVAGEVLGTIAYMSWEQLCGETARVDARSDVYALGVIAYQLLAGRLPYPGLGESTLIGAVKLLGERAPEKLSRHAPAARGDIETVVMKALAREPQARYPSAAEFAADLERCLRQQPIEARPPTVRYVVGLFVRRHRALSAAIGLAAASLLVGAGAATWFALAESQARIEAEQRSAEARAANEFMQQMFAAGTPAMARGRTVTALDVLDAAHDTLQRNPQRYPLNVQAELRRGLGVSYNALGQLDRARGLLKSALEQAAATHAPGSPALLRTQSDYAGVLLNSGQYAEAEQLLRPLLDAINPQDGRAEVQELRLLLTARLGHAVCEQQRFKECDELLVAPLEESRRVLGPLHEATLEMIEWRSFALHPQWRFDEEEPLLREMLDGLLATVGPDHPRSFHARDRLAMIARERGQLEGAEETMRALLADRIRVQGAGHIDLMQTQGALTMVLMLRGKWDEAEPLARETASAFERERGVDNVGTLVSLMDLAEILSAQGRDEAAFAVLKDIAQRIDSMSRPLTSPDVSLYGQYAAALAARGRVAEALAMFRELEPQARALKSYASPSLGIFLANLGDCLRRSGDAVAARPYLEEGEKIVRGALGSEHEETLKVRRKLEALDATDNSAAS